MTGILRADYGGFNPRFVGVSYLFDSSDDYLFAQDYLTGSGEPSPAADLHGIALRSVFDHESRHYLDFLLSPYSMTVFRMRLQGLINAVEALGTVRGLDGDVLPVPLTRWATLDDGRRKTLAADWAELLGDRVRPVHLPGRSHDDLLTDLPAVVERTDHLTAQQAFERNADSAMRAYARIGQLTEGFGASLPYLRPPYLHEVSAYTVQLAAVWFGQGMAEFGTLLEFLVDSEAPQARALQTCLKLARLLEQDEGGSRFETEVILPLRRVTSITTWALFGNYQLDGARGCPSKRFTELVTAVMDASDPADLSGRLEDSESVARMWDRWDRATGLTSWRECLAHNLAATARGVDGYTRARDQWRGSTEIIDAVLGVLRQVTEHQRLAASTLAGDLSAFVDPFRYVHIPAGTLPHPDIRLEFRGFGVTPGTFRSGRTVERRRPDGTTYVSGIAHAIRDDAAGRALLDQKLLLESATEWCDLAFSELSVPDHVHLTARAGLADLTGKTILQLV